MTASGAVSGSARCRKCLQFVLGAGCEDVQIWRRVDPRPQRPPSLFTLLWNSCHL